MAFSAPNHTQTPNELFDHWLPKLREAELKVILVFIRKTLGWHKKRDRISLSQLEKLTGLKRSNITKAIMSLQAKGLIKKQVTGKNGIQRTFYELILHEIKKINTSPGKRPPPVPEKDPQKKLITKEKEKEKECMKNTPSFFLSPLFEKIPGLTQQQQENIMNTYPEEKIKETIEYVISKPRENLASYFMKMIALEIKKENPDRNKIIAFLRDMEKKYGVKIAIFKNHCILPGGDKISFDIIGNEFRKKVRDFLAENYQSC